MAIKQSISFQTGDMVHSDAARQDASKSVDRVVLVWILACFYTYYIMREREALDVRGPKSQKQCMLFHISLRSLQQLAAATATVTATDPFRVFSTCLAL